MANSRTNCSSILLCLISAAGCSSTRDPDLAVADQAQIVTTTVALRGTPTAIALGGALFPGVVVAEAGTNLIEFVGAQTSSFAVVGVTPVGPQPQAVAVGPQGQVTTANAGDQTLSVFLPNENPPRVDTVKAIGNGPTAMLYLPGSPSQSWVVAGGDNAITINFGVTNGGKDDYGFLRKITVGAGASSIALDSVRGRIYVANSSDGTISVLDPAKSGVIATIDLSGSTPRGIAVNPVTRRLWVALESSDEILGVPLDLDTVPRTKIHVGHQPRGIAVNSADDQIFVTSPTDNTVTIVDEAFSVVSNVIPVGMTPTEVAVDTRVGDIYVINTGDASLTAFHDPAMDTSVLRVPVRLCAVEGSDYARLPLDSRVSLLSLVQQLNDQVYMAYGSRVIFQPAALPIGPNGPVIPIIQGSAPDAGIDPGNFGSGVRAVRDRCDQFWQSVAPTAKGIPLVGAKHITNGALGVAAQSLALVVNPNGTPGQRSNDLCIHPRKIQIGDVLEQDAFIIDADQMALSQPGVVPSFVAAHELGHALMLGHGNGFDDDNNGTFPPANGYRDYDSYCDTKGYDPESEIPVEEGGGGSCPDGTSVMLSRGGICGALHPLQIETLREVGAVAPGAIGSADPAGTAFNDTLCSTPPCGVAPEIAMRSIAASETPGSGIIDLSISLFGAPPAFTAEYDVAVDMDNDASTGCPVTGAGIASGFVGAELVARIVFNPAASPSASATVFACQAGSLMQIAGASAMASMMFNAETRQPTTGAISVRIPDSDVGALRNSVRLQGLARRLDGTSGYDTLPHAASDAGIVVDLRADDLATCSVLPKVMRPGTNGSVTFGGLPTNSPVAVSLAGVSVATGTSSSNGTGAIAFRLPSNVGAGVRLVSVAVPGTLNAAFCGLRVGGGATTPSTIATLSPTPTPGGWNNSDVTVTLTASPVVGGAAIGRIQYSATGAQPIVGSSSTTNPTRIALTSEGQTSLAFHAVDGNGIAETNEGVTVRIDKTPPQIASTVAPLPNAFGWYGQTRSPVQVSYSCNDGLAGVLNCAAPATVSTEGKDQLIRGDAIDRAFNSASATATVSIDVTSPVVAYAGNAGVYTVDQDVSIVCAATDNVSGVRTSSCMPIVGPAYSFNVGTNTFTATATDYADNAGQGQTSFEVKVTYESLCNLTSRFSSSDGVAHALCQKLAGAQSADERGNNSAKAGKLRSYINQLQAQTDKAFTKIQASLLEKLVAYL